MAAYLLGRWRAALELLSSVPIESRQPVHWLHLARAQANAGRLVDAWDSYNQIEELELANSVEDWAETRRQALKEGVAVRERVPWAHIHLSEDVPERAVVYLDGRVVPRERLTAPYPVDPGGHTFLLEVDGQPWAAHHLEFSEGEQLSVPLLRAPDGRLGGQGDTTLSLADAQRLSVNDELRERWKLASYAGFAVGGALIATGTLMALRAARQKKRFDDFIALECPGGSCNTANAREAVVLRSNARSSSALSVGTFIAGGLGLGAGLVFRLVADDIEHAPQATVGVPTWADRGGLVYMGRF